MSYRYNQKLPKNVEKALDDYIERIKKIQWFKPSPTFFREDVDSKVKAALKAFGVEASIVYRNLKTPYDWDVAWDSSWNAERDSVWNEAVCAARDSAWEASLCAAWDMARDAAWDMAWDAARCAAWDAARYSAWGAVRDTSWGVVRDAAWGIARVAAQVAARGAADILATCTKTYKKDTPFVKIIDMWEMGMYPVGVFDGKFIMYSPVDFEPFAQEKLHEVILDGVRYVPVTNLTKEV